METIKEQDIKDLKVKVVYDECPENPREWNNFGKMVCFHGRYDLGDESGLKSSQFEGWHELKDFLIKEKKAALISPLFLYDHSGLWLKIGSFANSPLPQGHAYFDSGQVGFIYATAQDIKENFLVKRISKKILSKAEDLFKSEVETYTNYLNGNVYGFVVEDSEEKHVDSCYGFYSVEKALKEGIESAEWTIKSRTEKTRKNTLLPYIKGG